MYLQTHKTQKSWHGIIPHMISARISRIPSPTSNSEAYHIVPFGRCHWTSSLPPMNEINKNQKPPELQEDPGRKTLSGKELAHHLRDHARSKTTRRERHYPTNRLASKAQNTTSPADSNACGPNTISIVAIYLFRPSKPDMHSSKP
jgi:hypothetical protein